MAARKARAADPPELLRELAARLASGGLPRGIVLRGEERYFRERAEDMLRAKATEDAYEICVHDGTRGNPDFKRSALIDDLSGGGLFSPKRLVVIRGGADHLKKEGSSPSALTRAILGFLESSEDMGTVAISASSLRADHAVAKAVLAAGGPLLDLRKLWDSAPAWNPDPRQAELVRYAVARARELGMRLTPDQAVFVCAATGNDLFALDDQFERMRRMPESDLRNVVSWSAAVPPWTVAEHLVAGDVPRALAGIEALFRSGFQEKTGRRLVDSAALSAMLVGSLSRGVRRSLALAGELARGVDETEAARKVGVTGRATGEAIALARSRAFDVWARMLDDLAELDRRAKSSAGIDANDFTVLAMRWGRASGDARSNRSQRAGARR